jgi:MYXO-CTERM domain-containing protein
MSPDPRDRSEIEDELESTREHLAETVDALQHKLDVKSRASDKATEIKRDHGRELAIGGAAALAALVVLVVVRRRRR